MFKNSQLQFAIIIVIIILLVSLKLRYDQSKSSALNFNFNLEWLNCKENGTRKVQTEKMNFNQPLQNLP